MPRKKPEKKKNFYEIFKITKKGKTKTVKVKGTEKVNETPAKKQVSEENKILRNIFLTVGILVIIGLAGYFIFDNLRNFEYNGIKFEIVKFCDVKPCLILYQTKLPVTTGNGEKAEYNFYLRNDPRKLGEIKFEGTLNLFPDLVIDSTDKMICDSGDVYISIENLRRLYEVLGTTMVKDEQGVGCDPFGDYMYINIINGNETKITQTGIACYELAVNNCEIMKVSERFMIETLADVNKKLP